MERYFRTYSRALYNFLIDKGHTNITYDRDKTVCFQFLIDENFDRDVKEFYSNSPTPLEIARRRNAKIVAQPWLVEALKELGYKPFVQEWSVYDYRKPLWLYDWSSALQSTIDKLFDKREKEIKTRKDEFNGK